MERGRRQRGRDLFPRLASKFFSQDWLDFFIFFLFLVFQVGNGGYVVLFVIFYISSFLLLFLFFVLLLASIWEGRDDSWTRISLHCWVGKWFIFLTARHSWMVCSSSAGNRLQPFWLVSGRENGESEPSLPLPLLFFLIFACMILYFFFSVWFLYWCSDVRVF